MSNEAERYAEQLLRSLGQLQPAVQATEALHPAVSNARCGLMMLTGQSEAPPQLIPAPIATCADGALLALRSIAASGNGLNELQGSQLLTERAALMGLSRNGRIAPGGSCRLLDTADGRIAINLARDDDWALLPALLENDAINGEADQWTTLATFLKQQNAAQLVERGRLLGLPIALEALPVGIERCYEIEQLGQARMQEKPDAEALVLDLSTLWAGPLCSHLLYKLGARVIKVESTSRPDGARAGNADFYDLLNEGKQSLSLDLQTDEGRAQLKQLIAQADIVIESARPRGLRQMGIVAEALLAENPGLSWISITGYGRQAEQADWVCFGDDAAVAAGLSALMQEATGEPMFVGDAIADPLTGMHAALAAWHSFKQGGGHLVSLALRDVTAYCAGFDLPADDDALRERHQSWQELLNPDDVRPPQPRYASVTARPLGADNAALMAEFSL